MRLLGLGNIRINGIGEQLDAEYIDDDHETKIPKVQWVSEVGACEVKLLIPKTLFIGDKFNEESMVETKTFVEPHYASLKEGQMAQMVRFGYCKKESQKMAVYTHG